jgi:hypothetical protein
MSSLKWSLMNSPLLCLIEKLYSIHLINNLNGLTHKIYKFYKLTEILDSGSLDLFNLFLTSKYVILRKQQNAVVCETILITFSSTGIDISHSGVQCDDLIHKSSG